MGKTEKRKSRAAAATYKMRKKQTLSRSLKVKCLRSRTYVIDEMNANILLSIMKWSSGTQKKVLRERFGSCVKI